MKSVRVLTRGILCFVAALSAIAAQATVGLSGSVRAEDGAPVPGAEVLILTNENQIVRSVTTGENGRYRMSGLERGPYVVAAVAPGFELSRETIRIDSSSAEHDITLRIAKVAETVRVEQTPSILSPAAGDKIEGRALELAPLRGDSLTALFPLLPGLVRGLDGRIRMKGGEATQGALQVNGANVTDPATGNFAIGLPLDAIESVEVLSHPYSSEYGRFQSGVAEVRTRPGGEAWRATGGGFLPRLLFSHEDSLKVRGLRRWSPRFSVGGPLIAHQLFLAQSVEFRYSRLPVYSLPGEPTVRTRSFDSFTRVDARVSPAHQLTGALAIYPQRVNRATIDTFNPPNVTPSFEQRGFNTSLTSALTLGNRGILETTVNVKRYDVTITPTGEAPMVIAPEGRSGHFFYAQDRQATTLQLVEAVSWSASGPTGQHVFKMGVDLLHAGYEGASRTSPVEIRRLDGTLSERIDLAVAATQSSRALHAAWFAQDRWRFTDRIAIEGGLRVDRDGVLRQTTVTPRAGIALALDASGNTIVKAGGGLFVQPTPLAIGAFSQVGARTVTLFATDGVQKAGRPLMLSPSTTPLDTPRSTTWNVELARRFGSAWQIKVNHLQRQGSHDFIVAPGRDRLTLSSDGRSRYRETECAVRIAPAPRHELLVSYVRSRAEQDLNTFDQFFGNFPSPVIRENAYLLAGVDVPNRLLVRGTIGLPWKLELYPLLEIRNGFPFSLVDERQQFVGLRNTCGRFRLVATADFTLLKPIRVGKLRPYIGIQVLNAFNRFTPRDVQSNIASPAFGTFYNTGYRQISFSGTIPR